MKIECIAADSHRFGITFFPAESDGRQIDDPSARPMLLIHPAMGIGASYYEPLAKALAASGFDTLSVDLRGIGQSERRAGRHSDFGFLESATLDLPAAVEAAKKLRPEAPIFLFGHSLGGMLNCLYASLHQDLLVGLILVASCSDYYGTWPFPRKYLNLLGMQTAWLVSKFLGHYPGHFFGFGGREARRMVRDWAYQGLTGRFDVGKSPHDFETLLGGIRLPIIALSFSDDEFGPEAAVDHLLIKMPEADSVHHHLSPRELGVEAMGHFGWVRQSERILPMISQWLMAHT